MVALKTGIVHNLLISGSIIYVMWLIVRIKPADLILYQGNELLVMNVHSILNCCTLMYCIADVYLLLKHKPGNTDTGQTVTLTPIRPNNNSSKGKSKHGPFWN